MPITKKGHKILGAMEKEYGAEKGKHVFYASKNKGTITGVEGKKKHLSDKKK
jgi:hypothetical protein